MEKKWIGFDRRLKPEWLDFLSAKIIEEESETNIKQSLKALIEKELSGKESVNKTITVLMRIWYSVPDDYKDLLERAKKLLETVSSEERIWIHWGLIILRYPFVRKVSEVIGRLTDLKESVSSNEIKNRIVDLWGDRYTVKRMIQMVTKTMENFGFIKIAKQRPYNIFEKLSRKTTDNIPLKNWMIEILLKSGESHIIPLEEIPRQYCLFPFEIDISYTDIYNNDKLEIIREGISQTFVGLK